MQYLGPSWVKGEDGKFVKPELTIGDEALRWTYKYLRHGEGPWLFTPEQMRLVLWWYAIDEHGEFLWRDGVIQRAKGWGKDPFTAALAAFELCGNCRFSHWGADGKPVLKRPVEPWVQIVGVAKEQNKNTFKLFHTLFNEKAKADYQLAIGKELIYANGGMGRLEIVTSVPETMQGNRPSFVVASETHHWTKSMHGHELIETARNNASKVDGRVLAITNAYQPGQDSVAEADREGQEKYLAGIASEGMFYDSVEAPANCPLTREALEAVLPLVYGDSHWVKINTQIKTILKPTSIPSRSRRFFLNQIVASDDALVSPAEWDPLADPDLKLEKDDRIVLGLDGGRSDDSTALIAIRLSDRAVIPIKIWDKDENVENWVIDMTQVDGYVAHAMDRYQVMAFFSDVHPIESYIDKWGEEYRDSLLIKAAPGTSPIGYDMRGHGKEITLFNEKLVGVIRGAGLKHNGDRQLRRHVLNAVERPNAWGISFGKEGRESPKKVDAYAALLLAYIAMTKYVESGKQPKQSSAKRGWLF